MKKYTIIIIFFIILMNIFLIQNSYSILSGIDTSDTPTIDYEKDNVEIQNKDILLEDMKSYIFHGNLLKAGSIAKRLLITLPNNDDVICVYSIYLLSKNELKEASKYLSHVSNRDNKYFLYAKSMLYRLQKKYKEGIKLCNKVISIDDKNPFPWNILGRLYFDINNYPKAIECFKKSIFLYNKFFPAYVNLAYTYYVSNNYKLSEKYFLIAIKIYPKSFGANYGLVKLYEKKGDLNNAYIFLNRCCTLKTNDRELYYELGLIQLRLGKYKDAIKTAKKLINLGEKKGYYLLISGKMHQNKMDNLEVYFKKNNVKDAWWYLLKGEYYLIRGDLKKSLDMMRSASLESHIFLDPYIYKEVLNFYINNTLSISDLKNIISSNNKKSFYFNTQTLKFIMASFLFYQDRIFDAYNWFKRSNGLIQGFSIDGIDKTSLNSCISKEEIKYLNLGLLLYLSGYIESSKSEFRKALEKNKYSVFGNFFIAQTFQKQKKRRKAIEFYKLSLKEAPNFFPSLYALGETYVMVGNIQKACYFYKKALIVNQDPGIILKMGLLMERQGKYEEAKSYYQKLIKLMPNFFVGYNQLAWLLVKNNQDLDYALELAKKANKLLPNNSSILDTLGWICFKMRKNNHAIEFLKKSINENPFNSIALYHLGMVYYSMGLKSKAKEYFIKSLQISKNFEGASLAKKMLRQ